MIPSDLNALEIIEHFYPFDTPLRRLLLKHSEQVRDKASAILADAACARLGLDGSFVRSAAMLHDIGILRCNAPDILCVGQEPYIAHGTVGGAMLRSYGMEHGLDLEAFARVCERHTGAGLTALEIERCGLPVPKRDYLPETLEEKLVCLADKFYSKSGDMCEKSLPRVRRSLEKFGADTLKRFDDMCCIFNIHN